MIRFTGYRKYFGDQLILQIPDFNLYAGIYWLKGENGSGKTTLMKSIGGLIPFDGAIEVSGTDIRKHRIAYKSIVNYGEAEPLYPGFLTGEDLVRFYVKVKKGNDQQVRSIIETFGISSFAGSKIGTYSSGMVKKLSLVLAFIGNPKLILLDEPLITLDTKAVSSLQELTGEYCRSGTSFLITSHQELFIPGVSVSQLLIKDKTLAIL